ncbi:hypothetical protein ACSLBF_13065 [Pseudoalteromonas sp. T1lg65]|uniref:hypothetical protein n=1 Tax=Pseudoalteromonas sp. T1lg65 TaxID=2077101 RepID=UPI003F7AAF77
MTQNVVEIVKFKLKAGATEADLLQINKEFNNWLHEQPGLLYRSLAKTSQSDEYVDVIYWETEAAAKAVAEKFETQPDCQHFTQFIDSDSVSISHSLILSKTCDNESDD